MPAARQCWIRRCFANTKLVSCGTQKSERPSPINTVSAASRFDAAQAHLQVPAPDAQSCTLYGCASVNRRSRRLHKPVLRGQRRSSRPCVQNPADEIVEAVTDDDRSTPLESQNSLKPERWIDPSLVQKACPVRVSSRRRVPSGGACIRPSRFRRLRQSRFNVMPSTSGETCKTASAVSTLVMVPSKSHRMVQPGTGIANSRR